jgi:hypothetical protein
MEKIFSPAISRKQKNLNQIIKHKLSELDCRGSDELLKNKFTRTHEEIKKYFLNISRRLSARFNFQLIIRH